MSEKVAGQNEVTSGGAKSPAEVKPLTPVDVLRQARELITDSERWTQNEFARDFRGTAVSPRSELAVCWCAMGAVSRVGDNKFWLRVETKRYLEIASQELFETFPERVNDTLGHEAVLRMYDRAIELAEQSVVSAAAASSNPATELPSNPENPSPSQLEGDVK